MKKQDGKKGKKRFERKPICESLELSSPFVRASVRVLLIHVLDGELALTNLKLILFAWTVMKTKGEEIKLKKKKKGKRAE